MLAHSIIVLLAFFSCIIGPIFFAINAYGIKKEESETVIHHFLRG